MPAMGGSIVKPLSAAEDNTISGLLMEYQIVSNATEEFIWAAISAVLAHSMPTCLALLTHAVCRWVLASVRVSL